MINKIYFKDAFGHFDSIHDEMVELSNTTGKIYYTNFNGNKISSDMDKDTLYLTVVKMKKYDYEVKSVKDSINREINKLQKSLTNIDKVSELVRLLPEKNKLRFSLLYSNHAEACKSSMFSGDELVSALTMMTKYFNHSSDSEVLQFIKGELYSGLSVSIVESVLHCLLDTEDCIKLVALINESIRS